MLQSNKGKLIKKLNKKLIKNSLNENFQDAVEDRLKTRNLTLGEIAKILKLMSPLETQDEMTLYFVCDAVYYYLRYEEFNPSKFFTEAEVKAYKDKKIAKKDRIEYPLVFQPVIKINDKEYILKMSEKEVDDLFAKRIATYNTETQRPLKDSGNIDVSKKAVNEIAQRRLDGEQKIDPITLNVLDNGEDTIEYIDEELKLIIHSGEINIPDGFHRILGDKLALSMKPDIKFDRSVIITNYDLDNANDYIVQKDKRNPINRAYMKRKDPNKLENKVLNQLEDKKKSEIAGLISFKQGDITKGEALTHTSVLIAAIEENFEFEFKADTRKIGRFLVEFFNVLVSYYPGELLRNIKENRKKNYINNQSVFAGYIAIASEIMGKQDWEDILMDTLDNIDFSKSNPVWKELHIEKKKYTKGYIQDISNYFKSKIVY